MEVKRRSEAPRITREQQRRIYDASLQLLEKCIEALHQERNVEVERVRRKRERALPHALERSEIVLEEEEEEEEEMAVVVERPIIVKSCRSEDYPPTETSSMAGDDDEGEDKDEGDDADAMDEDRDENSEEEWQSKGSPSCKLVPIWDGVPAAAGSGDNTAATASPTRWRDRNLVKGTRDKPRSFHVINHVLHVENNVTFQLPILPSDTCQSFL